MALEHFRRRRQRYNRARKEARARAPNVHPRTIGNVFELPPLLLLAAGDELADWAAFAAVDDGLEVVEEALDKLDDAAAVGEEIVLEEVVLESELEVVAALELVVALFVFPIAEVTAVKTDPASDRRELKTFCPTTVVAHRANGNNLKAFIVSRQSWPIILQPRCWGCN